MQTNTEQDQTYNGWTNYATWGVALVLDNDQGTSEYVRERFNAGTVGVAFEDFLKDYTEELCGLEADEDTLSLMARQVLQAGLSEVNWREIAENIASES